jgi:exodeoxyribonuclease-3
VTLPQRRLLVASVGDLRVVSLYVPNGQAVGSAQYDFKLDWMAKLADFLALEMKHHPKLVVMGQRGAGRARRL